MAKFDASGCPSDFLARIRQHEAEVEDKKNLIAKEKQLIADLEQQILEKEKGTRDLEIENANLESSIEHLNVLYVKQEEDNKRLLETQELLKEQVRTQAEKYKVLKEKNQLTKERCENIYNNYKAKFIERMAYYETLPYVPEYKQKMAEIVQLRKVVEQKRKEEAQLRKEVELLQEKKDLMKPKFTLAEWGIQLAELYQEATKGDLERVSINITSLEKDIDLLKEKKRRDEENARCAARKADPAKMTQLPTTSVSPIKPSLSTISPSKPTTSIQYGVPDFRSFFKDRCNEHKRGSSGSSLTSAKHFSLPSLASLMPLSESKKKVAEAEHSSSNQCSIQRDDVEKTSKSSLLTPQVQKLNLSGSFQTGRPLSEWLNPPKPFTKEISRSEIAEKPKLVKEEPAKDSHASRSLPTFPHSRVTEKPLLRQVQEKMLQKKMGKEKDEAMPVEEKNVEEPEVVESSEETTQNEVTKFEKQPNLLALYDGPSYEVPMATEEDETNNSSQIPKGFSSPSKHFPMEEHERMMAEIQKSPEDFYHYQANLMPMEGADTSFLISPPHKTDKASNRPITPQPGDFQFAIPTEPPPGHSKRTWSPGDMFGETQKRLSPQKSFSGEADNNMQFSTSKFSFNMEPSTPVSSEPSSFTFSFGAQNVTSPPSDEERGAFSFGVSSVQSPPTNSGGMFSFAENAKTPDNSGGCMFSFGGDESKSPEGSSLGLFTPSADREETSSSSFASLFSLK